MGQGWRREPYNWKFDMTEKLNSQGGTARKTTRRSRPCVAIATVVALTWAGATAYYAYQTSPHLPMDISANDAGTREAFNAALREHTIAYMIIALLPLLVLLPLTSLVCTRRGGR